ncbi:MAG: membrane protein insertion efficiency factor YidD [Candidatus Staskawiczbacteria bacterium CG10_big_fil_rev_8_21_14_0_10_38_10]|uniref:Putative membrane protein insertion efficiency factor n=1 Tax=Candidatus Staskawiczbacteria bacterium CG10_big_fil_rev_8_21_14_0_10_38_10 TaxID=1974891 RepID=A0A2H9T189_9BACT|nr:MAG: membrane protein insertion efficiency factor YidD [Candidatus Staskawiczbacteria bacterium CG10_big_fil_rev_8_21_14_0_10_38_10]
MLKLFFLNTIRFYQNFISSNLEVKCRFYPSCSQYTLEVIEKQGVLKGGLRGIKRIFKCHPFNKGGVDLP